MRLASALSILSAAGSAWAKNHLMAAHEAMAPAPVVHIVTTTIAAMDHTVVNTEAMVHTTAAQEHAVASSAAMVHSPAAAMTHTVTVGGTGIVFTPSEVVAAVGDIIDFVFLAQNHTLTQSTFDKPCVRKADAIDSGFMPNPETAVSASSPKFQVTVDSPDPTWWYCKQKATVNHCGGGMVFAINPTAEKSFAIFQAAAIAQNGTAAAAPSSSAAAAAPAPSAPVTLTVDNGGLPAAPTATVVAPGWNSQGNPQACNCACLCGAAAFPQGDGVGAFGGFSGSLPAPWG